VSAQLTCTACGTAFEAPRGAEAAQFAAEESARCVRLGELAVQRKSLDAARTQAGFAGVVDVDTADLVVHRETLSRLDAALRSESEDILRAMRHRRP
jgi:hypothetical protein